MNATFRYFLFFICILALMTFGFSKLFQKDASGVRRTINGEIIYIGSIDQQRVEKAMALYQPNDRLLISSPGGDLRAGMDFGYFISQRGMSVEVVDYCISSCANYIFLAGQKKILHANALVIFHGGPKQENFLTLMESAYSEPFKLGKTFGYEGYEAVISTQELRRPISMQYAKERSLCGKDEVLNRLGECELFGPQQHLQFIIDLEDELYSSINPLMDKNIPYYGQQGRHKPTYNKYKFFGFYYSLASLAELNVTNVEVKGGDWQPQTNPLYNKIYEVEIE